ncbi:MAG: hypothetical protein MJE77_38575 [Proteobacteria bacterium]|nr:hypothetical protein [Pseudomonadota bacterium]
MRAITMFRAAAWLGVAVIFWSLNVRWGTDTGVGGGPPTSQWERFVVAAGLLALIAALSLSLSGRKDYPPSFMARGVAALSAAIIASIAFYLHSQATGALEFALEGDGWTWLVVGGALVVGAVLGSFGLKAPIKRPGKRRKRRH